MKILNLLGTLLSSSKDIKILNFELVLYFDTYIYIHVHHCVEIIDNIIIPLYNHKYMLSFKKQEQLTLPEQLDSPPPPPIFWWVHVVYLLVFCVVFFFVLFVFVPSLVSNAACFSGWSILDCPFGFLQRLFQIISNLCHKSKHTGLF